MLQLITNKGTETQTTFDIKRHTPTRIPKAALCVGGKIAHLTFGFPQKDSSKCLSDARQLNPSNGTVIHTNFDIETPC